MNWHPVINHPKWIAYIGRNVGYDYVAIHATQSPLPIFYSDWSLRRYYLRTGDAPFWWIGWQSTKQWLAGLQEAAA